MTWKRFTSLSANTLTLLLITVAGYVWVLYVLLQWPPLRDWAYTPTPRAESDYLRANQKHALVNHRFSKSDLIRDIYLDETGNDILVNLRIQKTGSSAFSKHLLHDLDFDDTCTCRYKDCKCLKNIRNRVLFSNEENIRPCGTHADWTLLHECAEDRMDERQGERRNRRYFYVTMLRDPVERFVSEWLHTRRGAGWENSRLICNGRSATKEEVPSCYNKIKKNNISLKEFYSCSHNLAINRQTRMLANLSLVNCYNMSTISGEDRNIIMLNSAKDNLRNIAYFGITEYQILSQILFENTFKLKFMTNFHNKASTDASRTSIPSAEREKIAQLNKYDIQLYEYAKDLFFKRLDQI